MRATSMTDLTSRNAESLRLWMIRNFEAAGVMDLTAREAWIERACKIQGHTFTVPQLRRILAAQAEELATPESAQQPDEFPVPTDPANRDARTAEETP